MKIILRPSKVATQRYQAHHATPEEIEEGLKNETLIEVEPGIYKEVKLDKSVYSTKVMTADKKSKTTKKPGRPPAKKKPGRPRKTAATK